jgi:hypothetical protein
MRSHSGFLRTTAAYRNTTGATEGSIMPIIITAHIAKSNVWWAKSQLGVIIQAEQPVIGPYMSNAIGAIQAQHRAITATRVAPTNQRS